MRLATSLALIGCLLAGEALGQESGLVLALRFAQRFGDPRMLAPSKDRELKIALVEALRREKGGLTWSGMRQWFDQETFQRLAGADGRITMEEMKTMLEKEAPISRRGLLSQVRNHAELLATQYEMIDDEHRAAADELAAWLSARRVAQSEAPINIIVVCTGNSRRSMFGAVMGNIAAAYYGLPNLRFYSGGTSPSAFNSRTIAAMREIGVEIEPTGEEAPRGEAGDPNPIHRVRWGREMEMLEFSKKYADTSNPQRDFVALLVCTQADAACPTVRGAAKRLSIPYLDPKDYDGSPFEAAKYAERRDDIGRFMLNVMMQVRRRLSSAGAADRP